MVYQHESAILEKITDRYLKFRTLLSRNIDVHISDIYQPLKVRSEIRNMEIEINDNHILNLPKISCIIGKAGQGKTTLLKKIFLNVINHKDGIFPIIITLRNIDYESKFNLEIIVINELKSIGLEISKEQCICILAMKRIRLLFDGYDEVPDRHGKKALDIIKYAYNNYGLDCIVTSRPGTEITREPGIINFDLLDLEKNDILNIIENHKNIPESDKEIFIKVIKSKTYISEILITPILVDIFCSTYNSLSIEPKTLSDFYNELFKALASTHDRLKNYFERKNTTGLDNHTLELIMHSASFRLLEKRNDVTFKSEELISAFDVACEKLQIKVKDSHIDIIDKTSLIKDEELTYSYIHKSIIEFFSAKYIAKLPDTTKQSLYIHFAKHYKSAYENVLKFLHQIDQEHFYIFFAKNIYDNLLQENKISSFDESSEINDFLLMTILNTKEFEYVRRSFGMETHFRNIQEIILDTENVEPLDRQLKILLESTDMNFDNDSVKMLNLSVIASISKEEVKNNDDILKLISKRITHTLKDGCNISTFIVCLKNLINTERLKIQKLELMEHTKSVRKNLNIINERIKKHEITHRNRASLDMLDI